MTASPEFEIRHDGPLPASKPSNAAGSSKYPFAVMEIGDHFSVPLNGESAYRVRNRVYNAAKFHGLKLNYSLIVRTIDGGIGVWRVE